MGLLKKYIISPNPSIKTSPQPSPLVGEGVEGILPRSIVDKYQFISKSEAVYKVHFPKNNHDIEVAKYRLAYEELFDINYKAISSKYEKFEHTT